MSKKIRLGLTLGLILWSLVYIPRISYAQLADTPWPMFKHNLQHTGRSPYVGPSLPKLKWSYTTGGWISSSPAIGADGTIYVGSDDKNLYALNPNGSLKWSYSTGGSISWSSPAIGADGTIYVGSGDKNLYAIVQGELLSITTTTLPNGVQNVAYSQILSATGGLSPYTWSLSAGSLPAGLTLSQAGVISGTPTATGTFQFTVQVQDSSTPKQTATKALSIIINPPLSITTTSLANGVQNVTYSQTLSATGGITPYTWSLSAGTLPAGLTLSQTGVISGTPTTTGTFSFTVQVQDSSTPKQTATKSLSITINASLTITTTSSYNI